ncbi:DUF637 domain-containing protein, partial [Pseudomonas psychrophila]|uniref:DUF637 domain-containing protein n=1 Tax=Pseudomonas psychrophila TaxID=122355 RepID=UPI00178C621C
SGNDIAITSGGAVTLEAVKDLHQESHEKSNNNAFWVSSKGKGNTDETLRQTQMIAEGNVAIKAVEGLKIDVNQVNQQTVSQSIEAMVKADPQLAWIKDAEARGDVDWMQVKEIHDSFKYNNSGLGPASQIIIAIVMAAVVGPAAMGAMTAAGAGAGVAAGAGAVAAGAATNATASAVNNRGNLAAVIKDVTSSDAVKGYVISGVTAGITVGYFDDLTGTQTNTGTSKVSAPLSTWKGVGQFAANQTLQSGTSLALNKALGQGGNVSDALKIALFNTLAAASFNAVGDYTKGVFKDGSSQKIAIHAMVGGLLAEATGGDFKTGALAAGANEALVGQLYNLVKGDEALLTMSSQIVGVLTAAVQTDSDAPKIEKGAWVAKNGTQYNFLNHQDVEALLKDARECSATNTCDEVRNKYADLNDANDKRLSAHCAADPSGCYVAYQDFVAESNKTLELLSQARVSGDIPDSLKNLLGAVQLFNTNAKLQLVEGGITLGTAQAVSDAAAGLGFNVESETVGSASEWLAILAAVGRGKGAKGIPSIPNSGASSAANAAKLKMQLVAEQAAGTRAPTLINGYSAHALEQFAGRDGGIGVSQSALNSAWSSPLKIEYVPSKYGPTFRYTGADAVIVVNAEGKVVTGWGKSSSGTGK